MSIPVGPSDREGCSVVCDIDGSTDGVKETAIVGIDDRRRVGLMVGRDSDGLSLA
jgi:hypothetical protein